MMVWARAIMLMVLLVICGEAAKTFHERVQDLEARNVPIRVEEVRQVGKKKHLVLHQYQGRKWTLLGELPPLDIDAFIEHGLAEKGDKLEIEYNPIMNHLTPYFLHASRRDVLGAEVHGQDVDATVSKYLYTYRAGPIGYVHLPKEGNFFNGWADQGKAYYVRVPFNLFPKLDGQALGKQLSGTFSGYDFNTCKTSETPPRSFDCVVLKFSSAGVDGRRPTEGKLITRLLPIDEERKRVKMITAKEMARFVEPKTDHPLLSQADQTLASDSYVQYVIALPLPTAYGFKFDRMEQEFVKKHGRLSENAAPIRQFVDEKGYLVANQWARPNGKVHLLFNKYGKENRVDFPMKKCKLDEREWYCLRLDEAEKHPEHPIGITYTYEL